MSVSELDRVLVSLVESKEIEEYQNWYRTAFLASVICNVNRGKRGKTYKPEDFIGKPPWERKKKPGQQDWVSLVADAKAKGLKVPGES